MLKPIQTRSAVTITAPTTAPVMIAGLPPPCRRLILFPMADILPQLEQHVIMSGSLSGTFVPVCWSTIEAWR